MNPKVKVILLNYKNYKDTLRCLESLREVEYPEFKVMVVDNYSNDESLYYLRKVADEKIEILESKINGGFAYGNNLGIEVALNEDCDYVLLLNNDTIVEKDFIWPLIKEAEMDTKNGVLTSKIMFYPETSKVWYAGGKIDWKNLRAIHYGLKDKYIDNTSSNVDVSFASGCCMLIRKDVFKKVGMLSEEYFMYYEDMDFCIRVLNHGYKIKYIPESIIYHCVSSSSGGDGSPFTIEWQSRSRRIFMKKYRSKFTMIGKVFVSLKSEIRVIYRCLAGKNKLNSITAYLRSFRK